MKAGQSLRDKEIERNNAEIEEISPSVLKQIENMPKAMDILFILSYGTKCAMDNL